MGGDREEEENEFSSEAHFNVNANIVAMSNSLGSGSALSFNGEEVK